MKGVRVAAGCRISLKTSLAKGSSFFGKTVINEGVIIGKNTYATDAVIQNATLGNFCSIAPGVKIGLNEHPINEAMLHPFGYDAEVFNRSISMCIIGHDVWIGANSVILSGVVIGDGAVIAAGAVVTKNVPPFSIVGGVPAKVIKTRERHVLFEKLVQMNQKVEIQRILKERQ